MSEKAGVQWAGEICDICKEKMQWRLWCGKYIVWSCKGAIDNDDAHMEDEEWLYRRILCASSSGV